MYIAVNYKTEKRQKKKHETGFEPATLALARRYSTTEPLVHKSSDVIIISQMSKLSRIISKIGKKPSSEEIILKKRVMGIEPTYLAWKASVLPLNYTRKMFFSTLNIITRI